MRIGRCGRDNLGPSRQSFTGHRHLSWLVLGIGLSIAAPRAVAAPLFVAPLSFATGVGPVSVAIGDLNGDCKPDLVVANTRSNTVSVLLGLGDRSFGPKIDFATGS